MDSSQTRQAGPEDLPDQLRIRLESLKTQPAAFSADYWVFKYPSGRASPATRGPSISYTHAGFSIYGTEPM